MFSTPSMRCTCSWMHSNKTNILCSKLVFAFDRPIAFDYMPGMSNLDLHILLSVQIYTVSCCCTRNHTLSWSLSTMVKKFRDALLLLSRAQVLQVKDYLFHFERILCMRCGFPFYYLKIGFLEYLWISGEIQYPNGPIERRWQSGKKPVLTVLCMLGLLSTIIRGRESSDKENVNHEKIALAHEHNWAPITSTSAREIARTSTRRLGHPARGGFF